MEVAGKYTIHNETSENGNLLAQFATRNRPFPTQENSHGNMEVGGNE